MENLYTDVRSRGLKIYMYIYKHYADQQSLNSCFNFFWLHVSVVSNYTDAILKPNKSTSVLMYIMPQCIL